MRLRTMLCAAIIAAISLVGVSPTHAVDDPEPTLPDIVAGDDADNDPATRVVDNDCDFGWTKNVKWNYLNAPGLTKWSVRQQINYRWCKAPSGAFFMQMQRYIVTIKRTNYPDGVCSNARFRLEPGDIDNWVLPYSGFETCSAARHAQTRRWEGNGKVKIWRTQSTDDKCLLPKLYWNRPNTPLSDDPYWYLTDMCVDLNGPGE